MLPVDGTCVVGPARDAKKAACEEPVRGGALADVAPGPFGLPQVGGLSLAFGGCTTNGLTPGVSVTVSKYALLLAVERKAIPPKVMPVPGLLVETEESRVVPLLSNSLPMIAPLMPQSTSMRYQ